MRDASLPDTLDAVIREIDLAIAALSLLERRLAACGPGGDPAFEAQAFDAVLQQLAGLGGFVTRLAGECEADWRVRRAAAAACLTLGAQKARLGGETAPAAAPAGEFEWL